MKEQVRSAVRDAQQEKRIGWAYVIGCCIGVLGSMAGVFIVLAFGDHDRQPTVPLIVGFIAAISLSGAWKKYRDASKALDP